MARAPGGSDGRTHRGDEAYIKSWHRWAPFSAARRVPAHPSESPPRHPPLPLVPAQTPPRALTAVRPEPPRRARALKQPPAIGVLRAAKHVIERRSLDVFFILLLPVARPAASAASAAAAEPPRVRFPSRVVARLLLPAPSRALERQDVEIARDAPKGVAATASPNALARPPHDTARGDEGPRRARPRGGGRSRAGGALFRSLGAGAGLGGSPEEARRRARRGRRRRGPPGARRGRRPARGARDRAQAREAPRGTRRRRRARGGRSRRSARVSPPRRDPRPLPRTGVAEQSSRSSSIARAADWTRPRRNDRANLTRRG